MFHKPNKCQQVSFLDPLSVVQSCINISLFAAATTDTVRWHCLIITIGFLLWFVYFLCFLADLKELPLSFAMWISCSEFPRHPKIFLKNMFLKKKKPWCFAKVSLRVSTAGFSQKRAVNEFFPPTYPTHRAAEKTLTITASVTKQKLP